MGEVATETSEAQTMAAKNNMQGRARSRKVRRIARAITSGIEGVEPRSFTPEQASCKKEEKTLTAHRGRFYLPSSCGCLPSSHKYDKTGTLKGQTQIFSAVMRVSIRARRYHYSCHQCQSSPRYMLVMMMKLFEFPILLMFKSLPYLFSLQFWLLRLYEEEVEDKYTYGIGHPRTKLDPPRQLKNR
jgi:hypothetical protein